MGTLGATYYMGCTRWSTCQWATCHTDIPSTHPLHAQLGTPPIPVQCTHPLPPHHAGTIPHIWLFSPRVHTAPDILSSCTQCCTSPNYYYGQAQWKLKTWSEVGSNSLRKECESGGSSCCCSQNNVGEQQPGRSLGVAIYPQRITNWTVLL